VSGTKVEEFVRLSPARWRFLTCLSLERELTPNGASRFALSMELAESLSGGARLELGFKGVTGLEIGSLEGLLGWLLEIRAVEDRGLEEIRFRVVESENDAICFWCADFDATIRDESGT
jgi:hypothetical protein